jgi:hypothetical protein
MWSQLLFKESRWLHQNAKTTASGLLTSKKIKPLSLYRMTGGVLVTETQTPDWF